MGTSNPFEDCFCYYYSEEIFLRFFPFIQGPKVSSSIPWQGGYFSIPAFIRGAVLQVLGLIQHLHSKSLFCEGPRRSLGT